MQNFLVYSNSCKVFPHCLKDHPSMGALQVNCSLVNKILIRLLKKFQIVTTNPPPT